jgi:DNA ligase D-like protein (predicted ligase)
MTLFDERPIKPMMGKDGKPFDSRDHFFEIKWDGLRSLLFLQHGKVELQNRNLRLVTESYPELKTLAKDIDAKSAIIDGEVVVFNERGTPDFGKLQTRFGHIDSHAIDLASAANPSTYVAFDLLNLNGKDKIHDPLEDRKRGLNKILVEGPHLVYGDSIENEGLRFMSEALKLGFEGIIAKEKKSQYLRGTRSSYWTKIKGVQTIDAVVVGYSAGEGNRASTFGSLIMAMYDENGKLHHVGNVGGGFDFKTLDELRSRLDKIVSKAPILNEPTDAPLPIVWVKPRIVSEVFYQNFTHDRRLRFPRFQRIRSDKKPEECVLNEDILSR